MFGILSVELVAALPVLISSSRFALRFGKVREPEQTFQTDPLPQSHSVLVRTSDGFCRLRFTKTFSALFILRPSNLLTRSCAKMLYCLLPWVIGRVAPPPIQLVQPHRFARLAFSLGTKLLLESLSYDNQSAAFFP